MIEGRLLTAVALLANVISLFRFWELRVLEKVRLSLYLLSIMYLRRISDLRMQGSALRRPRMFKQLCGTNNLSSVILATTHWKNAEGVGIPEEVGIARIKKLRKTTDFWGGISRMGRHSCLA
jgi:hypothetical protein